MLATPRPRIVPALALALLAAPAHAQYQEAVEELRRLDPSPMGAELLPEIEREGFLAITLEQVGEVKGGASEPMELWRIQGVLEGEAQPCGRVWPGRLFMSGQGLGDAEAAGAGGYRREGVVSFGEFEVCENVVRGHFMRPASEELPRPGGFAFTYWASMWSQDQVARPEEHVDVVFAIPLVVEGRRTWVTGRNRTKRMPAPPVVRRGRPRSMSAEEAAVYLEDFGVPNGPRAGALEEVLGQPRAAVPARQGGILGMD